MTEQPQINRRYFLEAEQIAKTLSASFERRNLKPFFTNLFLFQDFGMTILIAVLDTTRIGDHSQYIQDELLHQLKTELGGRSVYLSNSTGLRYVIPLTALPKLPRSLELPRDIPLGMVSLGMRFNGQIISMRWSDLGHLLIVGMTWLRQIKLAALTCDTGNTQWDSTLHSLISTELHSPCSMDTRFFSRRSLLRHKRHSISF
jgi:hypothetical protein